MIRRMDGPQRIYFIGNCGSGKTTAARDAARRIGGNHVELDALNHRPNWTVAPIEEFRAALEEALAVERWTVDGNYSKLRDLILPRCDTIVWLDYPLQVSFARLLKRTFRRALLREELWHGNRESLWTQLFTRESLLFYALHRHGQLKHRYPGFLEEQRLNGKKCVRLRTPRDLSAWNDGLGS